MVNRGRPSKDCFPCRRRKLKCDLRPQRCGQCQRARLTCSGYRDPNALIIRDETALTEQKVNQVDVAASPHNGTHRGTIKPVPKTLELAWDVQARAFFFSFYVHGISTSTHNTLPRLYSHTGGTGPLSAAVDAVGLAFLSHQHRGRTALAVPARQRYVEAISLVNTALGTPDAAVSDATLQAVLLLDMYEKILNCGMPASRAPSRGSWMAHVKGALALARARGDGNYTSETSRLLGIRLVTSLLLSCHATSSRVPEGVVDLCHSLDPYCDEFDIKWRIHRLVVPTINLKADVESGVLTSPAEILQIAQDVETMFIAAEAEMEPVWRPKRVDVDGTNPLVFGDHYDVYRDHLVTQGVVVFHLMRIHLLSVIYDTLNPSTPEEQSTREMYVARRERVAQEICASAPQFILPGVRPENTIPFSPIQSLQCYAISSPLYIAGSLSQNPELRGWVVRTMEYIADAGGLEEAKAAALVIEKGSDAPFWSIYNMLGSYAFA